ncbi:unnamed protein product [Lactuca virosa]|uniref:Uncharacterized protein n=1 Tax=Lactuca virosa TaxID=75947 RepID=A0AAU9NFR5_9ASTR|nr:unnamed protein product [Lactuca virosa]
MVVSNVDFRSMSFMEFISYVKNLVKDGRINVYYCLPQRSLRDGLRVLEDENDYVRFLDVGYENGGMINLYIDHSQYLVMEWIEEEIAEDGSIDGNTDDDDDDVDSELSDDDFVEHEPDDEVIQLQPSDDLFIKRKFFKPPRVVDDEKDDKKDVKKDLHKYPVHDPNQKWDTMFPVLGRGLTIISDQHKGLIEAVKERVSEFGGDTYNNEDRGGDMEEGMHVAEEERKRDCLCVCVLDRMENNVTCSPRIFGSSSITKLLFYSFKLVGLIICITIFVINMNTRLLCYL